MEQSLTQKQGNMNIGLRFILCIPAACVWLAAAYFAFKWFGHMARGTITYGNERAAVMVPFLSGLALVGAVVSLVAVAMTCLGKMKLRWQGILFCAGLILLWSIAGD
jgi:Co/Zn/Cd efflux system component